MGTPIQTLIKDYNDLHKFLIDNGQVSEAMMIAEHYRKILLLSVASYYETKIIEIIKNFVSKNVVDEKIAFFVTKKAISRQYHTYFAWDENNVNKFLSMFGSDFKETIAKEIKDNKELDEAARAFLTIGNERNKMVHNNFLECKLDKTFDEIVALQQRADLFIAFLEEKFSKS